MLGIPLGILTVVLGIKAFTPGGLPLTRSRSLHGGGAKATGAICIFVGLIFVADGTFATWRDLARVLPRLAQNRDLPAAPAAANMAWAMHDCPQGGYAVLMPGKPNEQDTPGNLAIGLLGGHMSIVEKTDDIAFLAQCSRFAVNRTDAKRELDVARDNLVVTLGAKLQSQQDVQLDGQPGRELVVSLADNAVVRARYYLVGRNLFQVMASVPRGQESSNEVNAFFASFRLLPAGVNSLDGGWPTHDCPEGGFSIRMPGTPKEVETPADPETGSAGRLALNSKFDGASYTAERIELFRERIKVTAYLDAVRDAYVRKLKGAIEQEKDCQLDGLPGREIVLSLPDGRRLRARYFVAGKNVFQILAYFPQGRESASEADEYFASFRLLATETKPIGIAWARHDCAEGGFSILMPGKPTEKRQPSIPKIAQVGGYLLNVKLDGDSYSAGMWEHAQEYRDEKTELESFCGAAVAAIKGKLERTEDLELDGHPGREIVFDLRDDRIMRVRVFFAGKKHYQITATIPRGYESSEEIDEYFNSFFLLPAP